MSRRRTPTDTVTHVIVDSSDRRALCGRKDPMPVVLARFVQAHVDGYGLVLCQRCVELGQARR